MLESHPGLIGLNQLQENIINYLYLLTQPTNVSLETGAFKTCNAKLGKQVVIFIMICGQ